MIDPREFRRTLGLFVTGITVVTMRSRGRTYGITVNSFMSASLRPPLIAVCIDKRANAHATLLEEERFGISILRAGQEAISDHYAGRTPEAPGEPLEEFDGFPVVQGALGHLLCRRYDVLDAGDHSIFLGEVEALRSVAGEPLTYSEGGYGRLLDARPGDEGR